MHQFIIKYIFILLLGCGVLENLYSRYIPLHFRQITINDGLSINNIEFISEDSLGYIWFCSQYGLNRFDGYEVKRYYANQSEYSLPDNTITSIFCDSSGRLWIGTHEGIVRYEPSIDGFIRYDFKVRKASDINARLVTHISEDNLGRIWFVTEKGSFYHLDATGKEFMLSPVRINEELVNVKSFYINKSGSNTLWIGTNLGLIKYDLSSGYYEIIQFVDYNKVNLLSLNIQCILPDGNYLWLGIYRIGIIRYNTLNGQYKIYRENAEVQNYIINGHKDREGNIWFGTGDGLFLYNKKDDSFFRYGRSSGYPYGLTTSGITTIYQDSRNIYWVGTNYEGVNYSWGKRNFLSYQVDPDNRRNLSERRVNGLTLSNDGYLWVVHQTGIDLFDKKKMQLHRHFENNPNDPFTLGGASMWKAKVDEGGRIWISTYQGGLQRYDPKQQRFISYPNYDSKNGQKIRFDIRDISFDRNGCLWLATHGAGFSKFDPSQERFYNYKTDSLNPSLNWSYAIYADHKDRVWVGTTSGLFVHNLKGERLAAYFHSQNAPGSLSHNYVNVIFSDYRNRIWLGTSKGLNLFSEEENCFRLLDVNAEVANYYICGIEEDSKHNLWVSTRGNGLFSFNPDEWLTAGTTMVNHYDKSDGLQSNEFSQRSSYKDYMGYIYFGGIDGFTIFHPDSMQVNLRVPKVIISQIKLFDEVIYPHPAGTVTINSNGTKTLVLKHFQNVLTLGFTAINYQQPYKNKYLYKLEGFDDRWYSAGISREAVYTNLPAGNYLFKVIASNNDGVWNREGAIIEIIVLPPWWQTGLFRFTVVFLFVGLLYALFLWRIHTIRKQKHHLELMVQKKTSQLERQNKEITEMSKKIHEADQFKIRFFMNVSHEFRTPLTLILAPLNKLMNDNSITESLQNQLSFIQRSATRLLRLVNQLLDIQKMEMKQYVLNISQVNISDFVLSIFQLFEYAAKEKNIVFRLHISPALSNTRAWIDTDAVEKILYNLLSNAFKHTPEKGMVELRIEQIGNNDKLIFTVFNSGKGIDKDDLAKIFDRFYSKSEYRDLNSGIGIGLTLVRELVLLHNGKVSVESEIGIGTKFIVELPARYDGVTINERNFVENMDVIYDTDDVAYKPVDVSVNKVCSGKKILIVEDDTDLLSFLISDLKVDFDVKGVGNGKIALDVLPSYLPDLIISDVMMPEMNGFELCEMVKKNVDFGHIPIILLTAKTDDQSVISGYETGADDYIAKPFNTKLLKVRICNLIENRQKLRQHFDRYADLKEKISGEDADSKFLQKAIDIVEKNISNTSFGHKELATALGIGKTNLYLRISQITGYSINIFIRIIRLKKAAILLETGSYTVAEVAYQVGFNDPNYFSRCFKDYFQINPSEHPLREK